MSVRRKFCNAASLLILQFFSIPKKVVALDDKERQYRYQLIDALDHLKNDLDDEVVEAAYESEKISLKYKDISDQEY